MTRVIFIHPDNRSEQIEAENDASVMVAALTHGIDGIVAECGGNAVCATCHVYVDETWLGKLDSIDADEDGLLDGTASERRPNSRLSCQIKVTPALDGLMVRLPERQS